MITTGLYQCVVCGGWYDAPHNCPTSQYRYGFGTFQPITLTEERVKELIREHAPRFRVMHRTTLRHHKKNKGSKRYPEWVDYVENEEAEILEYSTDGGKTWLNVPHVYDTVEYHGSE